MTKRDTAQGMIDDLVSGFGLLSRIPVPMRAFTGAASVWVWPVVGAVIGGLSAATGMGLLTAGAPAGAAAAGALAVSALLTGAMHEDGLADTFDGLFGGWTVERRLEIMKDSHIGSYGVLALLVVTLARWSALTALLTAGAWPALVAVAVLSRAPMAALMGWMPNARKGGLSAGTGRPSGMRVLACLTVALVLAAGLTGVLAQPLVIATALPAFLLAWVAKARIGGQTGDILGASQILAETAALTTAAALLA